MTTKKTARKPAKTKKVPKKVVVRTKPTKLQSKAISAKYEKLRSFRLAPDPLPFKTTIVTRQTIYWTVLVVIIFIAMLWILDLQIQISNLTNQVLIVQ